MNVSMASNGGGVRQNANGRRRRYLPRMSALHREVVRTASLPSTRSIDAHARACHRFISLRGSAPCSGDASPRGQERSGGYCALLYSQHLGGGLYKGTPLPLPVPAGATPFRTYSLLTYFRMDVAVYGLVNFLQTKVCTHSFPKIQKPCLYIIRRLKQTSETLGAYVLL